MSRFRPTDIEVDIEKTQILGITGANITASFTLSDEHEVRCKWLPGGVTIYVDGVEIGRVEASMFKAKTFQDRLDGVDWKFIMTAGLVGGAPELEVGGVTIFSSFDILKVIAE
jgi:hypothetical protein